MQILILRMKCLIIKLLITIVRQLQELISQMARNISSQIIGVDTASGQNTYKQTVFVNPKQLVLGNTWVYIKGYQDKIEESSGKVSATDTKLRIFEVNDTSKLSDSYYADPNDSNLKEVTDQFKE